MPERRESNPARRVTPGRFRVGNTSEMVHGQQAYVGTMMGDGQVSGEATGGELESLKPKLSGSVSYLNNMKGRKMAFIPNTSVPGTITHDAVAYDPFKHGELPGSTFGGGV